jgi:serine protease Do
MNQWLKARRRAGLRLLGTVGGAALAVSALNLGLTPPAPAAIEAAQPAGASFADVVERVSPAVVNIAVQKLVQPTAGFPIGPGGRSGGPPLDQFFGRFFGAPNGEMPQVPRAPRHSEALGSGFLIDASGYIVTNNHVIDGADKIVATLHDGRKLDAKLVGRDSKTDLALLKVDAAKPLPYVELGDSARARVGDWVLAIGNPFGLGGTATAGIISARGRDIRSGPYDDFLQIDAPINAGNSGGPVFNAAGRVIGVSTAIFSPNGGNIGIGFAIPSDQVRTVVSELRANGEVERGWLGVQIQDLDQDLASSMGLKSAHGALVAEVLDNGPAKQAGLEAGDVITQFAGQAIDSAKALSRAVGDSHPGERVSVQVWRDGRSQDLTVKLGEASQGEPTAAGSGEEARAADRLGLALAPLTDEYRARYGVGPEVHGALIVGVDPDSPAAEKGLRPGDVITQIDRKEVSSVNEAVQALQAAKSSRSNALLLVRRGDGQRFVALGAS